MVETLEAMIRVVLPFLIFLIFDKIVSSVLTSTALTESSRINILGSLIIARDMEILCFCPPESETPFSPINVSYLSLNPSLLSLLL